MREVKEIVTRLLSYTKEVRTMCGIYMICNTINKKSYIGQAKDIGSFAGDIVRAIRNNSIYKGFYWAKDNKS